MFLLVLALKRGDDDTETIGRCGAKGMNHEEYLFNKKLLQEINMKKKLFKKFLNEPKK